MTIVSLATFYRGVHDEQKGSGLCAVRDHSILLVPLKCIREFVDLLWPPHPPWQSK